MLHRTTLAIVTVAAALTAGVAAVSGAWGPAAFGGAISGFGALLGLFLCHLAVRRREAAPARRTNWVLGAFVAGMLARLVLLGCSLLLLLVLLGWEPLAFIASFFLVHASSQILEIRYIHRNRHAPVTLTA